uniref:Uncharacterized protein n=1 Tax=Fagus sylvatica TaxID=28930 RepID=A0A2N9GXV7_FAGSY
MSRTTYFFVGSRRIVSTSSWWLSTSFSPGALNSSLLKSAKPLAPPVSISTHQAPPVSISASISTGSHAAAGSQAPVALDLYTGGLKTLRSLSIYARFTILEPILAFISSNLLLRTLVSFLSAFRDVAGEVSIQICLSDSFSGCPPLYIS